VEEGEKKRVEEEKQRIAEEKKKTEYDQRKAIIERQLKDCKMSAVK